MVSADQGSDFRKRLAEPLKQPLVEKLVEAEREKVSKISLDEKPFFLDFVNISKVAKINTGKIFFFKEALIRLDHNLDPVHENKPAIAKEEKGLEVNMEANIDQEFKSIYNRVVSRIEEERREEDSEQDRMLADLGIDDEVLQEYLAESKRKLEIIKNYTPEEFEAIAKKYSL